DRLLRNVVQRRKPAFPELLLATRFIEIDDQVRLFRLKIRRRIVEREMAVLADTDEGDVDVFLPDQVPQPLAFTMRIFLGIDVMKRRQRQRQFAVETLPEVFSERRAMRYRQADIFVKMKCRDLIPRDTRLLDQRLEHFKLRCTGRYDDRGPAVF